MIIKKILLPGLMLASSIVFAGATDEIDGAVDANHFEFANDQTIAVKLSIDDQNRVKVQNDRIVSIICAKAGYCIFPTGQENKEGDLLMGLGANARVDHPFSAVVKTENDRTFTMLVMPEHGISKTVIFNPTTGSSKEAKELEANTPYQAMMSKLIVSMIGYEDTKKPLNGYSVAEVPQTAIDPKEIKEKGDYIVYPLRVFKGDAFVGMVSAVKNMSDKKLILQPKEFYHHGVIAGAVSKETLKPQEIGYSYQVWVNHETD